ncbi:carbohydrate binding domain-containing protein, partial [Opitutales bacterium]|nr:carbohydrate binding domain-containing protein [Opitutales bacterium]
GGNWEGQLGNGNTSQQFNPLRIYPPMGSGDWDGDGISNDREITDGTNALDPQDFNLITNGNFEDGVNAWTFDDGNTNSGSLEVESDASNVSEGSRSAKLSRTSTEYVRMYTAPISFSNQKNYQLSFQLKDYNSSFHPGDKMEFRFADGTVEEMNASVSFTPLNNSWTEVSMLFSVTPPTGSTESNTTSSGLPTTWNQNTSYAKGALVISNAITYIAQQAVPAGTAITSTAYWLTLDSTSPRNRASTNNQNGNNSEQTWKMSIQFAKFKTGAQYLDHFVLRAIPKTQVFEPIDYGSVAQGNEMNNTIHSHITLYVNGVEQGNELFSKQPAAKLQATGNNYMGGIDDVNQYDQSLNSAEIAQSFREEKDLPPYTFLFTPKETPDSLKIQSGNLTMDEIRLYDRGVSESDLVKLFHLDLAPNARDFDLSLVDPTDSPIESLMLVDLNNDGKLDILTEQANDKFSWSQNKFQTTSKYNGWPNYDYTYTTTGEMAEIRILWPKEEIRSLPQWKSGQESNATSGLADMFVVNWSENGKINNLIQAGGSSNYDLSTGNAVVAGKEGEVYLTGSFGQELLWGDLNTSGSGSFENAFISRLDQELSPTWVKSFDGGDGAAGQAIAIDQRGDIQVTGYFRGDLTSGQANLTSKGGTDAFLLQLDAYGNAISLRAHGGSGNDIGTGISADSQGGIIMAGTFEQTGEFFGDSNMTVLSAGKKDAFILRYDYQIVIPKQHFQVTVGVGADGSNKYFIDGEEAPDIELLRGLPYTFTLDGNTTENHPFYLALQGQGGDEYGWEYLQGVQNSRTTDGTLTFSLGFEGPSVLHYNCGLHSGMGGSLIIPSDERPRAAITYAAIDMGGNFIEDGNWTVSTSNGLPVYSGQSLLDSEKVLLTYHPPAGYFLVGWGGDLEADANATGSSIEVNLNQDRAIQALLTAYAPTPLELANNFTIGFTIRPTDETGQFVESNDALVSYDGGFSLDPESTLTTGTGKFSVNQDAKLDLNQDGQSDTLRADFTYLVSTSDWVTINVENLESDLGDGWDLFGGGGFTMTLAVDAINGSKHEGGYSILYDDGSSELGNWLSTNLRIDPISLLSE